MLVTVKHASGDPEPFSTDHGPMLGHKLVCEDNDGNECYVEVNTKGQDDKSANFYPPGKAFEFLANGRTWDGPVCEWDDDRAVWEPRRDARGNPIVVTWEKGKRDNAAKGPNSYGGRSQSSRAPSPQPTRQSAPQGASGAPGGTPAQAPRAVPTVTQSGNEFAALFGRAIKLARHVATTAELDISNDRIFDVAARIAHGWKIDLNHGEIRRDPTEAERAAAEAAKRAAAEAEAKRLADLAAEAQRRAEAEAAKAPGYDAPADDDDGDIPFGFLLMLGTALTFGAGLIA